MSDNAIDARAEIQAFLKHLERAAEEQEQERLNAVYCALGGEHPCGVRHPAFAEPKQCMVLAVNGNPMLVNGEPITKPANVRDVRCNRPLGHDGPHQAYTFYITSLTEWTAETKAFLTQLDSNDQEDSPRPKPQEKEGNT